MGNTIKTLSDGDITREALAILHNNMPFCRTINKQYDSRFAVSGAKNGGSLLIREPNQFTIRSGATLDTQDVTETTQTLTVATQRGVDVNFTSAELTMDMDDFKERILTPAMSRLAAEVEKVVLAAVMPGVHNIVYTTYGTAPVFADVQSARAKLQQGLTPLENRHMLMEAISMNSIVNASTGFFHTSSEIERRFNSGSAGHMLGFEFHESELTPTHTNGSRDDSTPVIDTTEGSGLTSGTRSFTSSGGDGTLVVGDIFTIANVYAVNPETKVAYPHLKQWAVATASAANFTTIIPFETPYTSGPKQNCSVSSETSSAVVFVAAGGSGTASATDFANIAYHKDAFTMVTADLLLPEGVDFAARDMLDNITMRVVRQYDINNDKFPCRFDVYFGQRCIRPEWACRLPG